MSFAVAVAAFGVLAYVLGFVSAVDAVMNARTPQGSIAWTVSLVSFPFIAVPAYWVFGRSRFRGYVSARRAGDARVAAMSGRTLWMSQAFLPGPDGDTPPAARAAERLAKLPFLGGNDVELLIDGHATFESIRRGIEGATEYVLFQFFIIKDDDIGQEMKAALMAKAREGVRVFFLYDEVGSYALSRGYKNELREAGVEVYNFHTRQGPRNRFQINFRNHRKIVVVDGRVAWLGGHNVGDEYLGRDPEFGPWRDTHVRIEGPAALAAQLSFFEDWNWATGAALDLTWSPADPDGSAADTPVLVIPSGPADEFETAGLMFTHAINSANDRIWIASPYFVPDEGVMAALQLAGIRGVDVRVLIPDKADHLMVYLAAFSYFDEAHAAGVRFFKYTKGFLHQKVVLVDDVAAAVGTANFDNRSFRLNFEVTALVADPDFVGEVERMLETDFGNAREVAVTDYSERPFWFRLAVHLARLTAPVQ